MNFPLGSIKFLFFILFYSYQLWIDLPKARNLNVIEEVWDHLDIEQNKRQSTSKEERWNSHQMSWRTFLEDYLKKQI